MKKRNIDLEHSPILTNHICKHIVLEAPTVSELEEKIKNYELILARAITNAYKVSSLTLQDNGLYHISPTGSYQAGLFMNFDGKKKEKITNPEYTLKCLKQLASLVSKNQQIAHNIKHSNIPTKEASHTDTLVIDADSEFEMDDAIANKQRELLEQLISTTTLTGISFIPKSKYKDPNTGKITMTLGVNYTCREIQRKKVEHTDPEEPGNR